MYGKRALIAVGAVLALAAGAGAIWLVLSRSDVALGRTVYAQQCASCHGTHLEGQPNWKEHLPNGHLPAPPHDATGHTWHHPDNQLFDLTKNGVSGVLPGYQSDMPAFKDVLNDREIWAVLAYIKSTWPPEIRARQEKITNGNDR
jgi:mono/diheme cytochrome c family protein